MKLHVKCDTWHTQEYFIYFANDKEIRQSTEHNFRKKKQGTGSHGSEKARPPCPGLADSCSQRQPATVKSCSLQGISLLTERCPTSTSPASLSSAKWTPTLCGLLKNQLPLLGLLPHARGAASAALPHGVSRCCQVRLIP